MNLPRSSTILAIVAALSLAINLFLAGEIAGRQFHRPPPPPPPDFENHLGAIWRDMPDADREVTRDIIMRHRSDLIDKWHASRAAGQAVLTALHATPFQPAELQAALGRWNDRTLAFRGSFQDTLVEIAGKISDDGRSRLRFGPGAEPHSPGRLPGPGPGPGPGSGP